MDLVLRAVVQLVDEITLCAFSSIWDWHAPPFRAVSDLSLDYVSDERPLTTIEHLTDDILVPTDHLGPEPTSRPRWSGWFPDGGAFDGIRNSPLHLTQETDGRRDVYVAVKPSGEIVTVENRNCHCAATAETARSRETR